MDYVLGSVAALITGNVTPSRPKLMKRALTPTKHQPSPNVTPKSEYVEDRSIFLSPSMQKKKAIVKKSPKRIFQNPELESTENGEGNLSLTSPKADKVKKHLKDELEADSVANQSILNQKSPKNKGNNKRESTATQDGNKSVTEQDDDESTPKKKKKKHNSESDNTVNVSTQSIGNVSTENTAAAAKSPKKKKQRRKSVVAADSAKENEIREQSNAPTPNKSPKKQDNKTDSSEATVKSNEVTETSKTNTPKKKNKRRKKKPKAQVAPQTTENKESDGTNKENVQKENQVATKKKNKKRKKSKGPQNKPEVMDIDEQKPESEVESDNEEEEEKNTESKSTVNPNAITDKESDSEHESDDEIESENEEINKKVLESEKPESSDEEDEEPEKVEKKEGEKKEGGKKEGGEERITEEEIKRTLFVGNVPFSVKCKKELKKIFGQHGQIETIRIRTVPIKDGRYTPKLAVIKNELHPERTTVNVYIKYADEDSVEKALVENNTILNENHLRVSRSNSTGAEHDPKCSVFIGNLPFAMEDEALRAKFENCGEIHSVRIIRDKKTNAGKRFGYVNFESKDGVELALALTEEDLTVKNRILRVKRCTQTTTKKKPVKNNHNVKHSGYKGGNHQPNQERGGFNNQPNQQRGGFRSDNNDNNQQRGGFRGGGNQGNQQGGGFRDGYQQRGGFRGGNQQRGGFRGGNNQGYQQRSGPPSRNNQGNRQRAFGAGNNQQRGGFNNKFGSQMNLPQRDEQGREGAHRRVMNKRKNQDGAGGDAPPNKKPKDMDQPKEKKSRKEFVGMTAEKKKKHKIDKGQKKKKALSEILTK